VPRSVLYRFASFAVRNLNEHTLHHTLVDLYLCSLPTNTLRMAKHKDGLRARNSSKVNDNSQRQT
jgi:hypothetical protein